MKLAVIGGGGVRSMLLARSIARRAGAIGLDEVSFMDRDPERLRIFGGLSREVAARIAPGLRFVLESGLEAAVENADCIITTVRPGGDESRAADERLAMELGVLGQETTGAGGFLMASRTIPALLEICRVARLEARPGAPVLNFSNPAGLVVQALRDSGYAEAIGICDAPSGFLRQLGAILGREAGDFEALCFGLNHLSFFSSLRLDGQELLPGLLEDPRLYEESDMRFFEPALARSVGMLLNEYLFYYYYSERAVANARGAGESRGELIARVNRSMLAELSGLDPSRDFERAVSVFERWYGEREGFYMARETGRERGGRGFRFDIGDPDEGGYAGVALGFLEAAAGGGGREMVLNLPNRGAIPGLADDDVVEISCLVDGGGPRPKRAALPPPAILELLRRVKAYERMAARAILDRDRAMAIDALFLHPLVASWSIAREIVGRGLPGWALPLAGKGRGE
jgi:6-phospho-beta-glucosidase